MALKAAALGRMLSLINALIPINAKDFFGW